jgi:hypothetical protein
MAQSDDDGEALAVYVVDGALTVENAVLETGLK